MSQTIAPTRPLSVTGHGVTAGGLLRSEWIKLRTVRSTVWSYAVTIVVGLGFAALLGQTFTNEGTGGLPGGFDTDLALQTSTAGLFFGQLSIAVLGVLVITAEYSTGMIRSTLSAVPRRLPALWAKAVVLAVVTFGVGLVIVFGSYFVSAPLLAADGIHTSLADDGLVLALVGGALYLAFVSVISLGIGTIVRSSAGGVASAIGLLLLVPILLALVPADWAVVVSDYLPTTAGASLYALPSADGAVFSMWQGLLVMLGWTALTLGGGAALLARRDA